MHKILRESDKKKLTSMSSLKRLKRLYLCALDNHRCINNYFGVKLLICYGCSLARLLWGLLATADHWKRSTQPTASPQASSYDLTEINKFLVFLFCITAPVLIITRACKELSQIVTTIFMKCYLLQSKVPYKSYEYEELRALRIFIFENRLSFTAAGFFIIDPSVLLGIAASVVTYLLVLLQFS
ncbi:hypothetical protein ABEB36_004239 [Hypothenemus hampei]|uniref:Uncharacterized protein n=1 Tax=Hypothenemus hampei TaxID=57062 RepID=A0ABD1F2P3_HYPHA